jgi:UDP-N-acetyl-D-mannosaminuronic acid dehydrogenase
MNDTAIVAKELSCPGAKRAQSSTGQVDVAVVGGAGHVGIPLVLSFAAKGLNVMIHDLNVTALDKLRRGELPFVEHEAQGLLHEALKAERLVYSSNPENISCDAPVVITIGTPVDEFLNPVHRVVKDCVDELLPYLADGQLIILRSTVYPGTTDWLAGYLARRGRKLKVAFCPERVVQGYGVRELQSMPQLVSGATPEAEDEAAALFGLIAPELVRVKPMEAEFAKLFANAYRYIEFATTNTFYMLSHSAGVDYNAVLRAMKHNYPRAAKIPGPGFAAGPCLFKDTMQLAAFSRNNFALGQAAIVVNEGLVLYVVEHMRQQYDLEHLTVGLLGMAFKPEIDDTRSSLSYKIKKTLLMSSKRVLTTDPFVKTDPDLLPLDRVLAESDILVLCTPHRAYRQLKLSGKPLIDVWGFVEPCAMATGPHDDGRSTPLSTSSSRSITKAATS